MICVMLIFPISVIGLLLTLNSFMVIVYAIDLQLETIVNLLTRFLWLPLVQKHCH